MEPEGKQGRNYIFHYSLNYMITSNIHAIKNENGNIFEMSAAFKMDFPQNHP